MFCDVTSDIEKVIKRLKKVITEDKMTEICPYMNEIDPGGNSNPKLLANNHSGVTLNYYCRV